MTSFDPKERELCPDGACIGVIGPDGRCKECGALAPGREAKASSAADSGASEEAEDEDLDRDDLEDDDFEDEDLEADDHDSDDDSGKFTTAGRELCTDELCVGLIGPDGVCKECGLPGPAGSLNPRTRGLRTEEEVAEELEANIATSDIAAAPEEFDDRQLCPDGSCIGVIGPDGVCTECGARAKTDD